MKNVSIYIKPSERKCSVSNFKCFDIYDQDMKRINMLDCDDIELHGEYLDMEIVDGLIHIWSSRGLTIEMLSNTLIVRND